MLWALLALFDFLEMSALLQLLKKCSKELRLMMLLASLQFQASFVVHKIRKILENLVYLCYEEIIGEGSAEKYQEIIVGFFIFRYIMS